MSKADKHILEFPLSLELIVQSLPEFAYIISKKGTLLSWNKNLKALFGYSESELRNKFMQEFIYEPDKERVLQKFMEIVNNYDDVERTIEYRIITKFGKIIPILAIRSLVVINDEEYVIGIALDTSKTKKEKLKGRMAEVLHFKNQLQSHYHTIDKMNQAEIELKEKVFLNAKRFNSKLIDNLPGIFYAYEKVGDKFLLKKWNKNYLIDLGYPDDELLNMEAHQFFTKKEYVKVVNGLAKVFTIGKVQQENYTTHKNGKQIPYYYEAYKFEDKGKQYFVGVGINVSARYALEKEKKQQAIRERKSKEKLDAKERELITSALEVSKTNKIIDYAIKQIDVILEANKGANICYDLGFIRNDLQSQSTEQDNWNVFKLRFTEVHKDFFNKLKTKHPALTKTELKFCAYLRIHLSSAQISSVLSVTNEAIKKSRYRIRKKLGLTPKDSLEDYISKY